jgi:hypothetical protein
MLTIVLGPTFEIPLQTTSDETVATIADWIREGRCPFHAVRAGNHFTLAPQPAARHFWSPTLSLEVREEDGRPVAHGRFNPSPAIWTGFMLTYLALATIAIGASMWGAAQATLGRTPWAFVFIPACVLVGGAMFWASWVGQRLARAEMAAMRQTLDKLLCLDQAGPAQARPMSD